MTNKFIKLPALTLAIGASLLAQDRNLLPDTNANPFAHRDAALAAATHDPHGNDHLRHAMAARADLGATADDTFQIINVQTDDFGGTHARLQQYFKGVKVVNGQVISHVNARGEFAPFTNALKTRIGVATRPELSTQSALDYLARITGPTGPETTIPQPELVILPIMERYVIATGATVVPPQPSLTAGPSDKPVPERGVERPADPMNSADTARRVKEYRLSYEIRMAQGHEGDGGQIIANLYYVDANTGALVTQRSLNESATGQGHGVANPSVTFNDSPIGPFFWMFDVTRNFFTLDNGHPFSIGDPVNFDSDNTWGDGKISAGANATAANRQTAMVDGMFGATVYWDMMSNVFNRKGPDNKSHPVNVYAHVGFQFGDYSLVTSNIQLGDAPHFQEINVVGHEEGHGLEDFTAHLVEAGESGGINESNSDIWGTMATFYLNGGGFALSRSFLPDSGGTWVLDAVNRDLTKPSNGTPALPDYWYPSIGLLDPHYAIGPNNRMFFFLSEGASNSIAGNSSTLIPWGMNGLKKDAAAHIWFDALTLFMPSDPDYNDARLATVEGAILRFGLGSKQLEAVENAYAAINVGLPAASYPAAPPVIFEVKPNNNSSIPMPIPHPHNAVKIGAGPAPNKAHIIGGGVDQGWYSITLDPGETVTIRLESGILTDYDVHFYNAAFTQIASSVNGLGAVDQLTFTAPDIAPPNHPYYIEVNLWQSQTLANTYQMYLDFI